MSVLRTSPRSAPFDPSYLTHAKVAIDNYFEQLRVTPPVANHNRNATTPVIKGKIGAGDEIRTHDPNLGKVVLYP